MSAKIHESAPYRKFAEKLIQLRTEAKLSRAELAEKLGISARSIINYENGERIPFGDVCGKMAQVFGITTDELLGVENPDLEMTKAQAMAAMKAINGLKGERRLQFHFDAIQSALAGGELSEDQMQEYALEMTKAAMFAQQRLREIHTNKRFQATVETKAAETDVQVKAIDDAISSMSSEDR